MEEVLLSIIIGALEGATSWLVQDALSDPTITADTPVTWGYVVSGKCQYQYVSAGGTVSDKSGTFSMASSTDASQTLINCPDFTYYTIATGGTSADVPIITNYWSSGFMYDGRDYYTIKFSGDDSQHGTVTILTSNQDLPVYAESSISPLWSGAVRSSSIGFSNCPDVQNIEPAEIYLPSTYNQQISFNEFRQILIDWGNDVLESESVDETIPADSVPTWEQLTSEESTDTTEPATGDCCCNITVNASGDVDINNSADVDIDIYAGAGAFGAGAFGAGAIGYADVDVNGSVDIGEISGEFDVSGELNIEQHGDTITNNYYYDSTESYTIDYDEIMSPSEFYDIMDYTNEWGTYPISPIEETLYLPSSGSLLTVIPDTAGYCATVAQIISDSGFSPLLAPILVISFFLEILQR